MAEEMKQAENKTESCCCASKGFAAFLKSLLGLVFLTLGIGLVWLWRYDLLVLVKGCVGLFLILAGIITLAIAKE